MKNEIETTITKTIPPLKGKQELFCRFITSLADDTFDNGTKAYIKAGYAEKSAAQGASALMRKSKIKTRIRQLHAENLDEMGISAESVINNIRFDRNKARENNQWGVAASLDKLEGSILAMFSDRYVLQGTEPLSEVSTEEQEALRRLANDYKQSLCRGFTESRVTEKEPD